MEEENKEEIKEIINPEIIETTNEENLDTEEIEGNKDVETTEETQGVNNKNIFGRYLIIFIVMIIAAILMHLFTTKLLNNLIKDTPVLQLPNNGGDM